MALTFTGLILGLLLGVRHALEPDHLTAVSTLATEDPSPRHGLWLGALWGLGHSISLLLVGVVLALLHAEMPARLADLFEMFVGVMLVLLGVRAIVRARRTMRIGAPHPHQHHGHEHQHAGPRAHVHIAGRAFAARSLAVGMVHGLAGSGALTAMVLANLPSTASRLVYIALFGAGSIVGMSALSGAIGLPLARLGRRSGARATLSAVAGAISVLLGLVWGWPIAARLAGG